LFFMVFLADAKKQTSFILNRLASAKQPGSGQKSGKEVSRKTSDQECK